jgi:uncharacterized RDD family membrane protein YckC
VKCPKCGYLGFDSGGRCKNCGYDFSLVEQSGGSPGRSAAPVSAADLPGRDPRVARGSRYRRGSPAPGDNGVDRALAALPEGTPADLPLFRGDVPVLPPPRAPLAVRRSSPTPARVRSRTPAPQPETAPLLAREPAVAPPSSPALEARFDEPPVEQTASEAAPAGRRATAAAIDLGLLVLIDLVVLHFTLALCGLTFNDLHVLPWLPMAAFLLLLNGGYIVLFTGTLGQTIGKMATAIEVVPEGPETMGMRRALLRGAAMVVSLLPAGLGWLAGLVGDHRGLHDRLAGTRVVRVAGA